MMRKVSFAADVKTPSRAQIKALIRRRRTDRDRLALAYAGKLLALVAKMRGMVLAADLPGHFPRAQDSAATAQTVIADLRAKAEKLFGDVAEKLANEACYKASVVGYLWVNQDARALVGIDMKDVVKASSTLSKVMRQSIKDNVALIKTIPEKHFTRLEKIIKENFDKGALAGEIVDQIREVGQLTDRHAQFIARDQMAKVTSAANQERLISLDVDEYIWSTSDDERVRESHVALDGLRFRFDDPPDTSNDGTPAFNNPGFDFNCFLGQASLSSHAPIDKLFRHTYSGKLTELVTNTGEIVRATPHHPVLTRRGWIAIEAIDIGEDIFQAPFEGAQIVVKDPHDVQASAFQIFRAASLLFPLHRVEKIGVGFHGDLTDHEVNVVCIDRNLSIEGHAAFNQKVFEDFLILTDATDLRAGAFAQLFGRNLFASHSIVRGACKLLALLTGRLLHAEPHRGRSIAWFDSVAAQFRRDGRALDFEPIREGFHASARAKGGDHFFARVVFGVAWRAIKDRQLETDLFELHADRFVADTEKRSGFLERSAFLQKPLRIVDKGSREFSRAHVYNLQNVLGWYIAENVIVHNCRCVALPYFPELDDTAPPEEPAAKENASNTEDPES